MVALERIKRVYEQLFNYEFFGRFYSRLALYMIHQCMTKIYWLKKIKEDTMGSRENFKIVK